AVEIGAAVIVAKRSLRVLRDGVAADDHRARTRRGDRLAKGIGGSNRSGLSDLAGGPAENAAALSEGEAERIAQSEELQTEGLREERRRHDRRVCAGAAIQCF